MPTKLGSPQTYWQSMGSFKTHQTDEFTHIVVEFILEWADEK
jgi:hypothetical protein